MLPFLKRKDTAAAPSTVIVKDRAPNESSESEELIDDKRAAHEACARHLLLAIEARDVQAIADALQHAFEVMEAQEDETETASPHSFEAQNIIAGERK